MRRAAALVRTSPALMLAPLLAFGAGEGQGPKLLDRAPTSPIAAMIVLDGTALMVACARTAFIRGACTWNGSATKVQCR